jgi:hypothetical protein
VVVYWVKLARAPHPLSVKICPHKGAPVVAYYNAIWVLHRDYFENKSVSEELSIEIITYEEVDDTIHNPRSI